MTLKMNKMMPPSIGGEERQKIKKNKQLKNEKKGDHPWHSVKKQINFHFFYSIFDLLFFTPSSPPPFLSSIPCRRVLDFIENVQVLP